MPAGQPRHTDPRVKKTKLRLRRAYIASLTAGTEPLSVAHITALAGVTRGTFYQHYADKADFLASVRVDTVTDFIHFCVTRKSGDDTPHLDVLAALAYARDDQNEFAVLFQNDGDAFINVLHSQLKQVLSQFAQGRPEQFAGASMLQDVIELASMLDVAILRRWALRENDWNENYTETLIKQVNTFAPELHLNLQNFYQ